jgi:uncharacterized protein YggE
MSNLQRTPLVLALTASIAAAVALFMVAQSVAARGNTGALTRQSAPSATAHTVSVAGHGEITVPPTEATITLGVQTKGADAQTALSKNATDMSAVIGAVEAKGVPASHIQTSDLSIWYDSQNDDYAVSHQITVNLDNVNVVGSVLDVAVTAGANNSWGVSFGLKDPSAAKAQALQKAVADARSHADAMASALGVTISGVGSASETSYNYTPIQYGPAAASSKAASQQLPTPVQAGQLTITGDVTVVYTFS